MHIQWPLQLPLFTCHMPVHTPPPSQPSSHACVTLYSALIGLPHSMHTSVCPLAHLMYACNIAWHPLTWWTIGTFLLTNFLTIYIHLSHTPAGVIITSPTLLYLPSNPHQPHSIACVSFQILARIFTLNCWWFSWPYSHWNALPLPKHSLTVVLV